MRIGTRDLRRVLVGPPCVGMINYTERMALLMHDVVRRTPLLSFIDLSEVLIFARFGRADAEGAYATCHCLTLPESEPGYFFWRDRATGELTRRSEWFVTKSPIVRLGSTDIKYPDLVRAATLLISPSSVRARPSSIPARPRGSRARHRGARALSHRSRRNRHPPVRARGRQRFDAHARTALLRAGRRDGEGVPRVRSPTRRSTNSSRRISPG